MRGERDCGSVSSFSCEVVSGPGAGTSVVMFVTVVWRRCVARASARSIGPAIAWDVWVGSGEVGRQIASVELRNTVSPLHNERLVPFIVKKRSL